MPVSGSSTPNSCSASNRGRAHVVTPWFELDASGKDKGHPDAAGATGRVMVWGARGTRSAAIFDLDADGDLDIVTNEFNAAPMVLINNLTAKKPVHYIALKLTGTTSNRDGLGAIVRVTAGGTTYTKVMDGNSGYLSHSLYPLYFGLGTAERVDQIEVLWPSGKRQVIKSPTAIDSTLQVREAVTRRFDWRVLRSTTVALAARYPALANCGAWV